jgi:peptide/nickel transport system permease protein
MGIRASRLYRSFLQKLNPQLIVGGIICLFLVSVIAFPTLYTERDPYEEGDILQEIGGELMAAPFPPSREYPLGSDSATRDLATRVIYGARPTLLVCLAVVVLRLLLSNLLAWGVVWVRPGADPLLQVAISFSAAIPSLLFAFTVIFALGGGGAAPYIVGLTLTGWAEWTRMIRAEIILPSSPVPRKWA